METIDVKGIVLSSMPMGEYDRRLEILTDSFGRISAFARGARKPSSALVACSRTFAFGTFRLYQGRSAYTLQSAVITDYFNVLTEDFERNCYGSYFLELARYFSQEGLEADSLLQLLHASLKALAAGKISAALVKAVFEQKMIVINGIYEAPDTSRMSEGCAYTLSFVAGQPIRQLFTFKLTDPVETEYCRITDLLLKKVTDRKFKSLELLEGIDKIHL